MLRAIRCLVQRDHLHRWWGSARAGEFAEKTDDEMKSIRLGEQRRAVELRQYSYIAQLWFAMDLKPLIEEDASGVKTFVEAKLDRFKESVMDDLGAE